MTQDKPPTGYGTVDAQKKFNVSKFKLGLSGTNSVTMSIDGEIFLFEGYDDDTSIHFVEDNEHYPPLTKYTPTDTFWGVLVTIDTLTSEIIRTRETAYDELLPDINDYPFPYFSQLPKYEEVMAQSIYITVLRIKKDGGWHMSKKQRFIELFRRAYAEVQGRIPPKFGGHESMNESNKFIPDKQ
jgi:hypothetical protein